MNCEVNILFVVMVEVMVIQYGNICFEVDKIYYLLVSFCVGEKFDVEMLCVIEDCICVGFGFVEYQCVSVVYYDIDNLYIYIVINKIYLI